MGPKPRGMKKAPGPGTPWARSEKQKECLPSQNSLDHQPGPPRIRSQMGQGAVLFADEGDDSGGRNKDAHIAF